MGNDSKIWDTMESDIMSADLPEKDKVKLMNNMRKLKQQKINLMITGATGCGKSSTINALFNTEVAKVGVGVDPETMDIARYELDGLILWDTPGLGDGKEADNRHAKNITRKLNEVDENKKPLIDLVLVILDGSTRDLGTSYELINQVIIPNLGEEKDKRILVAINQADMAMKGKHWDKENNRPDQTLEEFLEEKVISVKKRIKEGTGVEIEPIYYSAGYKEEGEEQNPYNLSKLLYYIIQSIPKEKRLAYLGKTNQDSDAKGGDIGEDIGGIFGEPGRIVGRTVGTMGGAVVGAGKAVVETFVGGIFSIFGW